mmetsp:Transcript_20637/g.28562  ORF Transcript_20637/g.28562 Transcript_20637/m.28562 type:complete len:143 (-) Transcript_20637:279-707(-)
MVGGSKKRKFIDGNIVQALYDNGLRWNEIAKHPDINVSRDTFLKWRNEHGFRREIISASQLDTLVSTHICGQPRRGEIMIRSSYINNLGFHVTRRELRESLQRVDQEGIEYRKKKPIRRRDYSVPGPHYLWHQDGNHKLIRC